MDWKELEPASLPSTLLEGKGKGGKREGEKRETDGAAAA